MNECEHEFEDIDFDGFTICKKCNIEKVVSGGLDYGNEWRSCKATDNSRCQYKSYTDTFTGEDITKIMKSYDESDPDMLDEIYNLYHQVVKGDIIRYPFNKSVLFMCANTIYKSKYKRYLELNKLQKHFGLTRKQILNGIKYFNMKVFVNKVNVTIHNSISVEDYITSICEDLHINFNQCMIDMYHTISDRHKDVCHMSPKFVATAIVTFYSRRNNIPNATKEIMLEKYGVSDTSISKIDKILNKEFIIPKVEQPKPTGQVHKKKKKKKPNTTILQKPPINKFKNIHTPNRINFSPMIGGLIPYDGCDPIVLYKREQSSL